MDRMPEKKDNLDFSHLGNEVMVYSRETERAYSLNAVAGKVLAACDGIKTKAEVGAQLGDSQQALDLLELTLAELGEQGLLKGSSVKGVSRRSFLAKWGAVAAALPIIASIQAPQAAHAASGPPLV